jgi:hypothetical protein
MEVLFWIGLSMVLISAVVALVYFLTKNKLLPVILVVLTLVGTSWLKDTSLDKLQKDLRKEVPLQQVTIKGEQTFEAKIKIIYKDGKAGPVQLISGSTVQVETKKTEEKSQ